MFTVGRTRKIKDFDTRILTLSCRRTTDLVINVDYTPVQILSKIRINFFTE